MQGLGGKFGQNGKFAKFACYENFMFYHIKYCLKSAPDHPVPKICLKSLGLGCKCMELDHGHGYLRHEYTIVSHCPMESYMGMSYIVRKLLIWLFGWNDHNSYLPDFGLAVPLVRWDMPTGSYKQKHSLLH